MGANKIGRNEPCNCGSGKKYKVCCYLTEKNKIIKRGMNSISLDSYFIRLTDKKNFYMHLEEDNNDNYVYKVKEGTVGACGWHKKEGEEFIRMHGYTNLELVKMLEILGNDGTLN